MSRNGFIDPTTRPATRIKPICIGARFKLVNNFGTLSTVEVQMLQYHRGMPDGDAYVKLKWESDGFVEWAWLSEFESRLQSLSVDIG